MKPYDVGILFVHGIQGSPKQFRYLIEKVPPSVYVQSLTLPGHGATVKEFQKSDRAQWLSAVRKACSEMSRQCEDIIFVGHSMGCLLGLQIEQETQTFSAMMLICCPFFLRPTSRYFCNSLMANRTKGKTDDPYVKAAWAANGVTAKRGIAYLFCAHPYFELLRLIRSIKKQGALQLPEKTVFCYSKRDEIVGEKNHRYARERLGATVEVFEQCGHNYFTDTAKVKINKILMDMIKALS
ncbi:MAG: alpha/beta hydrolase [Ruminococcus sp.]|nr:alpha/beta hydrolase [Ruminococcus sp.]MBQ7654361.1 alpha/beta hydrolase [Clostridia bacterium]